MRTRALVRVLVCLGLAAAASAQALAWRLPPLGAAEYRRTAKARSVVAASISAAEKATPNEPVPEKYLPQLDPAPWLCQSELDRDQRSIATPVRDLRDVLRAIAFDLSTQGSGHWDFPRLVPFGDVVVSGSVTARGADGAQTVQATVDRRPAKAMPADPRDGAYSMPILCAHDLSGRIEVRRVVDADAGLVRSFAARATLFVVEPQKKVRRIDLEDAWDLVAVRENQDADFRARVAKAVREGSKWLYDALDGVTATWLRDPAGEDYTFGSGRLALAILTLLHAEVPAEDRVLKEAMAALRKRKMNDSYSLATALMTLSQQHAPPRESEMLRSGTIVVRRARELPDADRALAQKWLETLLGNRDTRVDPEKTLRFDYDGGKRFDNSVSQYGLLGLDAAALCGLSISDATWAASADHFLSVQCPARGPSRPLLLVTHKELSMAAGKEPEPSPLRAAPRGFSYQLPEEPPYGSLTAASLAGMIVARSGMLQNERSDRRRRKELDQAIDDAFLWLGTEFTARANPGFVGKADKHWYYWLYSLERACELAGIARLQGRDWYYEGALQLLSQQSKNGSFRTDSSQTMGVEATCFAILFLKKSTLPAITGK